MNTLIYTSALGFAAMLLEVLNHRKIIIPAMVIGLAIVFGLNLQDWNHPQTYFGDMLEVSKFSVGFGGLAIFITILIFFNFIIKFIKNYHKFLFKFTLNSILITGYLLN